MVAVKRIPAASIKPTTAHPLHTGNIKPSLWNQEQVLTFRLLTLIYRKFLKSSEIVYNGLEIKNDITKERRGLRHDVVYEVFCFGLG